METAGKMTEHLRLQGKVCFTRPKPLALEEFIHEFQCIIRARLSGITPEASSVHILTAGFEKQKHPPCLRERNFPLDIVLARTNILWS